MRQIWIGSIFLSTALCCTAASLGRYSGAAVIGRPLDIQVLAIVEPDEDVASLCVNANVFFGDTQLGAGSVRTTSRRSTQNAEALVRIQTTVAVNEPVISVVVRVGCTTPFSRRYLLLADPETELSAVSVTPPSGAGMADHTAFLRTTTGLPSPDGASHHAAAVGKPANNTHTSDRRASARPAAGSPDNSVARLQLDPVDLSLAMERDPVLALSLSLLSEPTTDDAQRAAAAQLWQAINATPEDTLRDAQKLAVLEAEVKGLREQETRYKSMLQAMEDEWERSRYLTWLAYGLGALLLLVLLGLLHSRFRRADVGSASQSKAWWAKGSPNPRSETDLKPRLADAPPSGFDIDLNLDDGSGNDELKFLNDADAENVPASPSHADPRDFSVSHMGVSRSMAMEELLDVQQQADFFVSLGEFDKAIGVLKNHLGDGLEPSPVAYLDLFRLYHLLGRRDDYEKMREEFNHLFNAGAPPFDGYRNDNVGLESHETAFGRIQALWPQPRVLDVIEHSIFRDATDPESEVFDLEAYRELLLLHAIAKDIIKRDSDDISTQDFQHTTISPLQAHASRSPVPVAAELSDARVIEDDTPFASPRPPVASLDVDLDALSEMPAGEPLFSEFTVPLELAQEPDALPGSHLPESNLIDIETEDFLSAEASPKEDHSKP